MSDQGYDEVVEGSTDPIVWNVEDNGASFNGTGMTLTATCKDKTGAVVSVNSMLAWVDPTVSQAKLTPAANTFSGALSPYRITLYVTNGGVVIGYPRGQAREIRVSKAGGA